MIIINIVIIVIVIVISIIIYIYHDICTINNRNHRVNFTNLAGQLGHHHQLTRSSLSAMEARLSAWPWLACHAVSMTTCKTPRHVVNYAKLYGIIWVLNGIVMVIVEGTKTCLDFKNMDVASLQLAGGLKLKWVTWLKTYVFRNDARPSLGFRSGRSRMKLPVVSNSHPWQPLYKHGGTLFVTFEYVNQSLKSLQWSSLCNDSSFSLAALQHHFREVYDDK